VDRFRRNWPAAAHCPTVQQIMDFALGFDRHRRLARETFEVPFVGKRQLKLSLSSQILEVSPAERKTVQESRQQKFPKTGREE
jgi:hypothetical protein